VYHSRDNASLCIALYGRALHGMSLSGGCLTIGKYCSVETFQNTINYWLCCIGINLLLGAIHVEGSVEIEVMRLRFIVTLLSN
jgi:hypothetical protein